MIRNFIKIFSQRSRYCTSANINAEEQIKLTDRCVARLKEIIKTTEKTFLRVKVDGGGCSGFQYTFELDDKQDDNDRVFERDEAKVVIDDGSFEFLKGSTVDYETELIRSAFKISQNPFADKGCSCGASFSVKL